MDVVEDESRWSATGGFGSSLPTRGASMKIQLPMDTSHWRGCPEPVKPQPQFGRIRWEDMPEQGAAVTFEATTP
jgi:hypothetical protein